MIRFRDGRVTIPDEGDLLSVEIPVDRIGYVLPSILLPLWDSELGKGFIATLRSILAGNDASLIDRSYRMSLP